MAMSQAQRLQAAYEEQLSKLAKRRQVLNDQKVKSVSAATVEQSMINKESSGQIVLTQQSDQRGPNSTRQLEGNGRRESELPRMASYRTNFANKTGAAAMTSEPKNDDNESSSRPCPTSTQRKSSP